MNTRNNSNSNSSSNDEQIQHLGSPFAALTISGDTITLATTGEEQVKKQPAEVAAPALTKPVVRRTIVMPARRKTPAIITDSHLSNFGSKTDREGRTTVGVHNSNETTAVTVPEIVALTGWDLLLWHKQNRTAIRGHVTRPIYSREYRNLITGVKVRIAGLEGFVPFRMLGMSELEAEQSVTLEMGFRVVELTRGKDGARDRIILNRQLVVTDEKTAALIKTVKAGDIVSGVIRKIETIGAFVDIDGASAMIHVTNLPQGNIRSVKIGQQVTAQVVKADSATNRLGLSIKHYFVSQLAIGEEFTGLVKNEESFGVFVQLNETVDGLVHVSQFGDFNPARGDTATVKVLDTNKEKGQVQLALLDLKVPQAS